jgi:hypothetical protein
MTKQTKNLIALGVLVVLTGVSYEINIASKKPTQAAAKALAAAKAAQQESPLMARFHRVRAEMDGLYHYRTKPAPFDTADNPFRIPAGVDFSDSKTRPAPAKATAADVPAAPNAPPEFGESLLTHAIALTRLGGVVTMNDTTQLTVNGELHKQGDVFTVKIQNRLVLIRIKLLTTSSVTLALDDPASGTAEMRVRLK